MFYFLNTFLFLNGSNTWSIMVPSIFFYFNCGEIIYNKNHVLTSLSPKDVNMGKNILDGKS